MVDSNFSKNVVRFFFGISIPQTGRNRSNVTILTTDTEFVEFVGFVGLFDSPNISLKKTCIVWVGNIATP